MKSLFKTAENKTANPSSSPCTKHATLSAVRRVAPTTRGQTSIRAQAAAEVPKKVKAIPSSPDGVPQELWERFCSLSSGGGKDVDYVSARYASCPAKAVRPEGWKHSRGISRFDMEYGTYHLNFVGFYLQAIKGDAEPEQEGQRQPLEGWDEKIRHKSCVGMSRLDAVQRYIEAVEAVLCDPRCFKEVSNKKK